MAAGMRGRHWDQLSKAVGTRVWPGEDLNLQRLLKINILQFQAELQVCQPRSCWAAGMARVPTKASCMACMACMARLLADISWEAA